MPNNHSPAGQSPRALKFSRLLGSYAVCQFSADAPLPDWLPTSGFISVTRTSEELSIVCPDHSTPAHLKADLGWVCLKLEGPFSFSLTGILSSFIAPLSDNAIPIFAISTYDTDYVLIKQGFADAGLDVLAKAGHTLVK
jgi:uncharacterized protein